MGDRLQLRVTQHAAGSLDGMHSTEDFGQTLRGCGVTLQFDQFALHEIESFGTLRQKLSDDLFHAIGRGGHLPSPSSAGCRRNSARDPAKGRAEPSTGVSAKE